MAVFKSNYKRPPGVGQWTQEQSPDAQLSNADWTKRTWDILGINSVEEMRAYLKSTGSSVEAFKKLPAYSATVNRPDWLDDL